MLNDNLQWFFIGFTHIISRNSYYAQTVLGYRYIMFLGAFCPAPTEYQGSIDATYNRLRFMRA